MPYANIGDAKLYYEIYGNELEMTADGMQQKPTLVVLHGGPGLDHSFEIEFSRECAPFAQTILVDLRGNGRSTGDNPKQWNLEQWADDVFTFCQSLGLEKPFVQGVSMGGWVTMKFACKYPDAARGIILLDTEAVLDLEGICQRYQQAGGEEAADLARKFFQEKIPSPDEIQQYFLKCIPLCSNTPVPDYYFKCAIMKPEIGVHFQKERAHYNILDKLSAITGPVLYLTNTTNPSHILASAEKTAEAMINAEVTFLPFPDCGLVQHDAKDAGVLEIQKFLEKNYQI